MVNVYAPFLLTHLLLPLLQKSQSARVVTVSSDSHKMGGVLIYDDFDLKNNYSLTRSYGLSKLYVIWIMRHFIKFTESKGIKNITFNCVHPGSTMSNLGRESTKYWLFKIVAFLWIPMMNSMEDAARPSITCATYKELEGVTGKYFGPKGEEKPSEKYYTEEGEQKIWDYCTRITTEFLQNY